MCTKANPAHQICAASDIHWKTQAQLSHNCNLIVQYVVLHTRAIWCNSLKKHNFALSHNCSVIVQYVQGKFTSVLGVSPSRSLISRVDTICYYLILFANLYWILFASAQCTWHCNAHQESFYLWKALYIVHCTVQCVEHWTLHSEIFCTMKNYFLTESWMKASPTVDPSNSSFYLSVKFCKIKLKTAKGPCTEKAWFQAG